MQQLVQQLADVHSVSADKESDLSNKLEAATQEARELAEKLEESRALSEDRLAGAKKAANMEMQWFAEKSAKVRPAVVLHCAQVPNWVHL